jgi:hypothetical protein
MKTERREWSPVLFVIEMVSDAASDASRKAEVP